MDETTPKSPVPVKPETPASDPDAIGKAPVPSDGDGPLEAYLEYNKTLRAWFVAYGVGVPALFLTNEKLTQLILTSGNAKALGGLFLLGAGCQVLGSVLNKYANWYSFYSTCYSDFEKTIRCKLSEWFLSQIWFDIALDIATVYCFGKGTWCAIQVVSAITQAGVKSTG